MVGRVVVVVVGSMVMGRMVGRVIVLGGIDDAGGDGTSSICSHSVVLVLCISSNTFSITHFPSDHISISYDAIGGH